METRGTKRLRENDAVGREEDDWSKQLKNEALEKIDSCDEAILYKVLNKLLPRSMVPHGPVVDDNTYVARHNAKLPQILRTFLNSWLILYDAELLETQKARETSLESPNTPEPNETREQETPKKKKLTKLHVMSMLSQEENWLTFVQRHSNSNTWAEMRLQQFTVVQIVREAVGALTPDYFTFNSNTTYKSESIIRTIQEERSTINVRSIKADMTVELNYKQFPPRLERPFPFYFLTVEVQKHEMTSVKDHKDYFKVCFALRNMLNDAMVAYSPKKKNLTAYGVLAGANGIALLALTTVVIRKDDEKALFFKLKESQIFEYKDCSKVDECISMLRIFAAETIEQLHQLEQTSEKFMDSAKAAHVTSATFNQVSPTYEIWDNDFENLRECYEEIRVLPEMNKNQIFERIEKSGVVELLDKEHSTEGKEALYACALAHLVVGTSLGFIQTEGKLNIFVQPKANSREFYLIWKDYSGYHTKQGILKRKLSEIIKESQVDNNDGNDDANGDENRQKKLSDRNYKSYKGKGRSSGSTSSSNSSATNPMNYCSNTGELVEELGFTIDKPLMSNHKGFAFISQKSQFIQCPVFVKLSIGTDDEEKVMNDVPKHTNLVQILKHERLNKASIEWKTTMENEYKKRCYLTVTEALEPYDQYFSDKKIQKLSGRSKLKILCHTMIGILKGLKELHKKNIIHGDLSIWNIMFRKSNIVLEDDFELYDAVITDMNSSFSLIHSIAGGVGRTRPFVCEDDFFMTKKMDCFSIGVLFAHYLKLIMTGDEWFMIVVTDTIENKKCHDMISKYMNESRGKFDSVFGEEYAACFSHLKAIIEGCMITGSAKRMSTREVWDRLQTIHEEI